MHQPIDANTSNEDVIVKISLTEMKTAALLAGDDENTFRDVMEKSNVYYNVGLTPAFLYNVTKGTIELTSEEKLQKIYH